MKNKLIPFAVMTSLLLGPTAFAAEKESCDESCQESIEFSKLMDAKEKQIQTLQKDIEIERIRKELRSLKEGTSDAAGIDSEFKDMILSKLESLEGDIDKKIEESITSSVNQVEEIPVIQDTTGIDNIFVTGTSAVGSEWKARVYYNNSIESLFVGEDVYPGATIQSIDRRGMVVVENGDKHVKRITSTEIAHARAFNNIQEENEIKQINRQSVAQPMNPDSFIPPY